jgi:TP901 family phage tail tape measure protein
MAKDKITQKDVIDPKIVDTFADLNKELERSVTLMAALTKDSVDLSKSFNPKVIQDVTDNQKKYNEAVEKSSKVNTDATTTADKLRKKIKEVSTEEEKLKIQLQKRRKEVRENIKAEKAEVNSINDLNRKNKILRERIKNVSTETIGGRKRIIAYNKAIDRNEKRVTAASDAMTRQKKGIGKYSTALKSLTSALGIVTGGFAIAAAAIRKGIQLTKEAIEINRTFEKTFANVLTLLNEAEKKEFGLKLEKGAVDILAEYGITIKDTNEALFDTISNGIELGDAINFLNKAAKLAIAGNAELSDVVKGSTKVYEVYKDEVANVDEVLNAFFAAQVEGATNVGLLSNNIGKVAATAKKAGIPINELFGTFAGLTKFLDGTEESATALVNVINSVIKVTPAAEKEFKKLGIETVITAIKQNGLLKTILQVVKATEQNEDAITSLIPNVRAFKGIAGLTAESIAKIEKNILDLSDTELSSLLVQNAFNEQMATAEKQAGATKGSYQRMLIAIGGGESIFKKIGTAVRSELKEKFDEVAKQVEIFRTIWGGSMDFIQITWQRVTGQLSRGEFRDAVKNNAEETAKSLIDIAERYDIIKIKINENTESINENTEAKKGNNTVTTQEITSIISLDKEIAALNKTKGELAVTDEAGIESINIQVKAIQDQIKALNDLGIKEEEIVKIKEGTSEELIEIIEEQDEKELELLDEKLTTENELTLEKLSELDEEKQALREEDSTKFNDDYDNRQRTIREYVAFAAMEAQSLNNQLFGLANTQLEAEKAADIEKAKSRGASEVEIDKIEKKYAEKRKSRAITQAIINTALGVTAALANPGGILGIVIAALAAVAGAIEIATISSASFAKGTPDSGDQWLDATVGEKGTERINFADGTSMYTPNGATKMLLPPHSEVVTNNQLQRDLADMQMSGVKRSNNNLEKQRKKDQKELIKAIKNRDETIINITENGLTVTAKRGINRISYINRQYRN